jgi:sortase A
MSFRVRLRFPKALLRRTEHTCFVVGFALLGLCAAILAQATLFQAYASWAFEQELRGATASYAGFVADALSLPAPAPPPFAALLDFDLTVDRSILGRIEIPRIGLKAMIREGVSQRTLALAVGHIPGTAVPGKTGNVGMAGHRDTFFRDLRNVRLGDNIIVTTLDGSFEYRVETSEVVRPQDTRVLNDAGRPELTLVTCYPFYYVGSAPERFVVHAKRVTF